MPLEIQTNVKPIRLYGITYSPNPLADEIEKYLEVPFPVKPPKVDLTNARDRHILLANLIFRGRIGDAFDSLAISGQRAIFLGNLHTFFTMGSDEYDHYVDRHENVHGWVNNVNSSLARPSLNSERGIVFHCVGEGIADWCTREIITKVGNPVEIAGLSDSNNHHATKIPTGESFTEWLIPGIRRVSDKISGMEKLYWYSYGTGLYFVKNVMDYLALHEIPTNIALLRLVQSPPTAIQQLSDPKGFGEELLAA